MVFGTKCRISITCIAVLIAETAAWKDNEQELDGCSVLSMSPCNDCELPYKGHLGHHLTGSSYFLFIV